MEVMEVMEVMEELDLNSNCLPPELEVKKLQQLVRRLELQNEQLRASGCPGGLAPGFGLGGPGAIRRLAPRCLSPPAEPFEYFQPHGAGDGASEPGEDEAEPSVLDGLELLDLEVLCCREEEEEEEEETWLYESPKAAELGDDSLTPLQWSRHVLDRPKTEVEAARRSLSLRLEQVSRWRSSLSSPSHSSPGPPLSRVAGVSPIRAPPCSTPLSSDRHAPSLSSSSLHHVLHRTFSPVGKEFPPPLADRTPTFLPHLENSILRRSALSPQSSVDGDPVTSEDESLTLHGYKLHDLTDVQVMARLQEENLRAHRYFSFINPRRSKAGLRQHVVHPRQPPQPELHLPAQPAQRRPRPGGGRRGGGGRRRLRPPAPPAGAPHPPAALPHLLQHARLAKKHHVPVHPPLHALHALHAAAAAPLRRVRLPASGPVPAPGTGSRQLLLGRASGLPIRIRRI